jgi:hypothetical protein
MIPFPFFPTLVTSVSIAGSQSFTTPGFSVFTVPAGITTIQVECIGAGGNGGAQTTNNNGAGGGGGGAYVSSTLTGLTPGATYAVFVGTGGNATYGPAVAGEDSYFGSAATVMAKGGSSVAVNVRGLSPRILGGQASASVGTIKYNGGAGGWSNPVNVSPPGPGGGGGAAGPGGAGGTASTLTAGIGQSPGGNGGTGQYDASSSRVGLVGNNYGGGGSGAYKITVNADGGSGANGWVRVTWLFVA